MGRVYEIRCYGRKSPTGGELLGRHENGGGPIPRPSRADAPRCNRNSGRPDTRRCEVVMSAPLWQPSPDRVAHANLTAFAARVTAKHGVALPDFSALFRWSTDEPEAFWREVWNDAGIVGEPGRRTLVDADKMPGARWFPDARLNFAENLLKGRSLDDADDALVFWGEDKVKRRVSNADLVASVSRVAQGLRVVRFARRLGAREHHQPASSRRLAETVQRLDLRLAGPNPARDAVGFVLNVPRRVAVEVAGHDVRGALVRRLAEGQPYLTFFAPEGGS